MQTPVLNLFGNGTIVFTDVTATIESDRMDVLVTLTGGLRLALIGTIVILNCAALFRVCFRSALCLNNMVVTAVVLANLMYLLTWPPFLVYSLSNGRWSLLDERVYCLTQNYVTNAMGSVLLSLLAVRLVERARLRLLGGRPWSAARNTAATFVAWVAPQLTYDLVALGSNRRACRNPVFHFLSEIARVESGRAGYSFGFMVCEQELTPVALDAFLWQFLLIVLPLATVAGLAAAATALFAPQSKARAARRQLQSVIRTEVDDSKQDVGAGANCSGDETLHGVAVRCGEHGCRLRCQRRMVVVDLILVCNLIWYSVGRPLMILHALYSQQPDISDVGLAAGTETTDDASFVDVGSHLMLAFSCVFVASIVSDVSFLGGRTTPRPPTVSLVVRPESEIGSIGGKYRLDCPLLVVDGGDKNKLQCDQTECKKVPL